MQCILTKHAVISHLASCKIEKLDFLNQQRRQTSGIAAEMRSPSSSTTSSNQTGGSSCRCPGGPLHLQFCMGSTQNAWGQCAAGMQAGQKQAPHEPGTDSTPGTAHLPRSAPDPPGGSPAAAAAVAVRSTGAAAAPRWLAAGDSKVPWPGDSWPPPPCKAAAGRQPSRSCSSARRSWSGRGVEMGRCGLRRPAACTCRHGQG